MTADVVVIGAGVMGAATARALTRAGRSVVVLDRFEVGHPHGSSHGPARIFRLSYPDERYVRMGLEALPLWRELEDEAGERLLHPVPALNLGPAAGELIEPMRAGGARVEVLPAQAAAERFGVGAEGEVVLDSAAAVIAADRTVRACVDSAVRHGARLHERTRVLSLRTRGDAAEVETEAGAIRARRAVVTAGAWARGLVAPLGIEVPTRSTRETVAYFSSRTDVPILIEWSQPVVFALPSFGQGIKAGEHIAGPIADPDTPGDPDAASVARLRTWLARRVSGAGTEPHAAETCLYTNTADFSFILERHGPVVVGSPCSGHGFKFAPLIGERLATLAMT